MIIFGWLYGTSKPLPGIVSGGCDVTKGAHRNAPVVSLPPSGDSDTALFLPSTLLSYPIEHLLSITSSSIALIQIKQMQF